MIQEKPRPFSLSAYATRFVFQDVRLLVASILYFLPYLLIISAMEYCGQLAGWEWVGYALYLPGLYIYGCFSLFWHRFSLSGNSNVSVPNPVWPEHKALSFLALFMALSAGVTLVTTALSYGTSLAEPHLTKGQTLMMHLAALVLIYATLVFFVRLSFTLPARSAGVILGFRESITISKGLVWPLVGGSFILGLLFIVIFAVYTFILGMVTMMIAGDVALTPLQTSVISFLASVPIQIFVMLLLAVCVAMLSRAYQWGMQNNSSTLS